MGQGVRHFKGEESDPLLGFIDDIQTLGLNDKVELPELVVVGDQSSGKSSLLQAITEVSFPVGGGLCTRFPIKISFRQTASKATTVKAEIIPGPISNRDEKLKERIRDFSIKSDDLTPETMQKIVHEATRRIFGVEDISIASTVKGRNVANQPMPKDAPLSDATLRIERSGPNEMHWSIIDLPGLVSSGPDTSTAVTNGSHNLRSKSVIAEGLVRRYLQNERTIVLVVIDNSDIERHRILHVIHDIPGLQSRCIGILSKCDFKQVSSDNWMPKLLRNEYVSYLSNFDHGWFGICNRKPKDIHTTDKERDESEREEFSKDEWREAPRSRTGIDSLMAYIDKERRLQLQKSMPQIIAEIRDNLEKCETEIRKLGDVRNTPAAQRYYVHTFCMEMRRMANAALAGRYQEIPTGNSNFPDIPVEESKSSLRLRVQNRLEDFAGEMKEANTALPFSNIRADLETLRSDYPDPATWDEKVEKTDGIYGEISRQIRICQGTGLRGDIHPDVSRNVFRKLSAQWKAIAWALVEDVKGFVKECNDILLKLAIADHKTRLDVTNLMTPIIEEWNGDINRALQDILDDQQERRILTFNPRLESSRREVDTYIDTIVYGRQATTNGSVGDSISTPKSNGVDGKTQNHKPARTAMSAYLTNIFQVRGRIEMYYGIALYRFIDNVAMQVVERHVLGPKSPILAVDGALFAGLSDKDLNSIVGEDEPSIQKRAKLNQEKAWYKSALSKWENTRSL